MYQNPVTSYSPMPPWQAPAAPAVPSSDTFLKQTMAGIQPGLDASQSIFNQATALQQQELALQRKADQDAMSRFYYATPPWGAQRPRAPMPAISPAATMPAPAPAAPQASTHTPEEMAAAMTAGAKQFSGKIMTPQQMADLYRNAGFVRNEQGRYAMPQLGY